MKLRTALPFVLVALSLAACGASSGWPSAVKTTMIDSCFKEAKAQGAPLADEKIKGYCECYQQNVQKAFPNSNDLTKATAADLSKSMQPCLELVLK
jgi:hypothetical protein